MRLYGFNKVVSCTQYGDTITAEELAMKLYNKKKFLMDISDADAAFLIRKIWREKGRCRYDNVSVVLQDKIALAQAKAQFWDL